MDRKYNLIIFGATSFTGKYLIQEAVNLQKRDKSQTFTWAVSARSNSKLDKVLHEVSVNTGEDLSNVDKILADISDYDSLREMAKQGEVLLNLVGPYALYNGEGVVRACIEEGTHYLDLSGESDFLETVQLKYNRLAEENGVYIVAPCGFDSIPADLGSTYLQQQFGGDLNSVEIYLQFNHGGKRSKINYGTWHSIVLISSKIFQLQKLHEQLYPDPLPKPTYKLAQRFIHYGEADKGWFVPNPTTDQRVACRSQRYFYHNDGKSPVQVKAYFGQKSLILSLLLMIGVAIVGLLAQFKFGRYLLETYPEVMSLGMFGREGPTSEQMDHLKFTFTLVGKGWDKKEAGGANDHSQPPNKTKILKVKGTNPGYGATNQIFLQCALALLEQREKIPKKGGVFTPGVAFANTNLVERLNQNGVTFAIE